MIQRKKKSAARVFEIREEPRPLLAWGPAGDGDRLGAIEGDVRRLLLELGQAKTTLHEERRLAKDGTRRLLLSLVEALDAFEAVFQSIRSKEELVTPQMAKWLGNFRTVYRLLEGAVSGQGVAKIGNLEQGFDPDWHRVAETVSDPSLPEGTIKGEVHKGYVWGDIVLRKAEVLVVCNEDAPSGGDPEARG